MPENGLKVPKTEVRGETDPQGFEPWWPAPKAGRISRLPHGPVG